MPEGEKNLMNRSRTFLLLFICVLLLNAAFLPLPFRLPCSAALAEAAWDSAAEAEAARAAAEADARALAEEYARLNAEAEKAEEAAEEAEGTEEEEALKKKAEDARAAADAVYQQLAEAAMRLKEATEASVRMAKSEAVDSNRISGSFQLGERYSGRFNEKMEPVYVHFGMTVSARAHMSTTGAKVSITVLDAEGNRKHLCYARPVHIGSNCWIGACVTICPGVSIGDHTVIGAGSVVTKDIPPRVIAAGNPCHVIREISEADKILGKYPESDVMEVQRRVAEIQEELNYRQTEQ